MVDTIGMTKIFDISLGPGSALGKKGLKIGERSELRGSLGRGNFPSPGHRSPIFSYLIPFFAFFEIPPPQLGLRLVDISNKHTPPHISRGFFRRVLNWV